MHEDEDDFDPESADDVTALAANLRAMGQTEQANRANAAAMALAEDQDDAPAAYEVADRFMTWLGDDYTEMLMERLGGDLTENLVRGEQCLEDTPYGEAFKAALERGDRREAFDLIVMAAEYSLRHRLPIEPTGYAHVAEPALTGAADRMSVRARIDEIYRLYPVGSEEYRSPAVQNKLAALFTALEGDEPIRGGLGPL